MKEHEIRPPQLFDEFLARALDDAAELMRDRNAFQTVSCPGCAGSQIADRFTKHGFEYRCCAGCGSLYVSPRPTAAMLDRFYRSSRAVDFFATRFYRETEDARRSSILRPRAALVASWAQRLEATALLADVGAGYGTFLEEVSSLGVFQDVVAIEPAGPLAASCREKGFRVLEQAVGPDVSSPVGASLCTCFEVLEHVHDPLAFLQALARLLRDGGALVFTTLTVSGFDIQELWADSKSVMPPNHLNLLSTAGVRALVARAGLDLVELSTPGELDVQIVANAIAQNPQVPVSRFARLVVAASEATRDAFQQFLQDHELSSHVRVIARRTAGAPSC